VFERINVGVVVLRGKVDEIVLYYTAPKNSIIQLVM